MYSSNRSRELDPKVIKSKVHIRALNEGTLCQLCRGKFRLIVLVTRSQLTSLIKQLHSTFVTKSHEVYLATVG